MRLLSPPSSSPSAATAATASFLTLLLGTTLAHDECSRSRSSSRLSSRDEFSDFFNVTEYPNQQHQNVTKYLIEAQELAGDDIYPHYAHRCILDQVYPELSSLGQSPGFIRPFSPFRDVYFVGQSSWSSWAIDTGEASGILLIDTLDSAAEVQRILIPALESLGFGGEDIRWVYITHEHGDHYNGARYLQETYSGSKHNISVLASAAAWESMLADDPEGAPHRDEHAVTVADGETLTFGSYLPGDPISFHETPGHTPGTLSALIPLADQDPEGTRHVAGLFGGVGIPDEGEAQEAMIASFGRFADLARAGGADVLLANHQLQDRALYHAEVLARRVCDEDEGCNTGNPFVLGEDGYERWLRVHALCVRTYAARLGVNLSV